MKENKDKIIIIGKSLSPTGHVLDSIISIKCIASDFCNPDSLAKINPAELTYPVTWICAFLSVSRMKNETRVVKLSKNSLLSVLNGMAGVGRMFFTTTRGAEDSHFVETKFVLNEDRSMIDEQIINKLRMIVSNSIIYYV